MKIAIFHDFYDSIGGGEKLIIEMARGLKADIITNNLNKESIKKMGCEDVRFINLGETVRIPPLKQAQATRRFSKVDFSKNYDFFILSGNWGPFAAKKHKPNLYYCNTPMRVFYDLYEFYINSFRWYGKLIFPFYVKYAKIKERKNMPHISKILANSVNIKKRIKKYWGVDSNVVHCAINTEKFYYGKNENYWLSVNRIYPAKRIELQLKAFENLPNDKLIIVGDIAKGDGSEGYKDKMKKIFPPNVEFLGKIHENKLIDLYANCRGFITTSINEDFGLTPIEAMASGKPVIAPNEGGYKETIINGKTGILIDNINVDKLVYAVKKIEEELDKNPRKYKNNCIKQAKKFDTKVFIERIKKSINEVKNKR